MRIAYVYDMDGWAIHNIGLLLRPAFEAAGHEWLLVRHDAYHANPPRSDAVHLGYVGLHRRAFPYRNFTDRVVCTIHDPVEVSNFSNRADWARFPLRRLPLDQLDAVSVTSDEMEAVLRDRYGFGALYRTPTFPHDAAAVRAAAVEKDPDGPVVFYSRTNASRRHPWRTVARRVKEPRNYLLDHRGRPSLTQLSSILVRTNRKNIALLDRLGKSLERRPGARVAFRHSDGRIGARGDYLAELARGDVYVCTSNMEGGPLPIMEAVLAGLAVLSTDVGQVREWVTHGENGFICRTFEEFRARAASYVEDRALLRAHQARSAAIAATKRFDARSWIDLVTGARPSPRPSAPSR